jgi:hypothetical protein
MTIELVLSESEKKAFLAGFSAGFSASFDGWNGEVFKEFNRPFIESENYEKNVKQALKDYEEKVREQGKLFSFVIPFERG